MKPFKDYEEAEKSAKSTAGEKLPVGAYVVKINAIRTENTDWGNRFVLAFDIAEGEHAGFFKKQFEANDDEDKKWKGRVFVYIPKDDGSEKDKITKKSFASWTVSFEKSNPGYKWDWDENKWVGKLVGLVFGETGTVIEGREVTFTEARFPVEADKVRNGTAPTAKFKAKNGYVGTGTSGNTGEAFESASEFMTVTPGQKEELPF